MLKSSSAFRCIIRAGARALRVPSDPALRQLPAQPLTPLRVGTSRAPATSV